MLDTISAAADAGTATTEDSPGTRDWIPPLLEPINGVGSHIYEGTVRHRRKQHVRNEFKFSVFMFLLDLDEIETVFDGHWLWSTRKTRYGSFRRSDYLKTYHADRPLKQCVIDLLSQNGIDRPIGKIRLLTQLRYCGFQMNPVSFYYCYGSDGATIVAIVAEVNNTPWGEQHTYVMPVQPGKKIIVADRVRKNFHVSPFMEMDMHYRFLFNHPGKTIGIKMENHQRGQKVFDVSLSLRNRPLNALQLAKVVVKYPLYSVKVFAGIYFQALKLYLKRVPFVPHPSPQNR